MSVKSNRPNFAGSIPVARSKSFQASGEILVTLHRHRIGLGGVFLPLGDCGDLLQPEQLEQEMRG